ncbi:hypothetical protein DENIS_0647 [Desulfonema ishimotonii]|uniref:Helicase ATP-binding domain-containing protein n=2 Tax=Desulfonema ishimotonii TaxID=45657 RepID=A0A401FRX2_9BACT|nr:hypothetical protein DENIS_0647 [Desulfonema ishimotonii]
MLKPYTDKPEQFAVVYTHAGLIPDRGNRIYAVAAKILHPDGAQDEFDSLVRYARHTEREYYYSGIPRKKLEDAPAAEEVRRELAEFLSGTDVLFILDDHHILNETRNFCGRDKRIVDLSFAAEFFMPYLRSCTAKSIREHLHDRQREKFSFSAPEVADLSVKLIRHITGTLLNSGDSPHAPVFRHFLQKSDTLFGTAFLHLSRHFQDWFGGLPAPDSDADTENWRPFLEKAARSGRNKKQRVPFRPVSYENLENLYRGLALHGQGFRLRPEQVAYGCHVAAALNDRAVLTLEAGTGTGKTQGYLIPVLEFLRLNPNARVVISTYTKNLQEQIFRQELTFTRDALPIYNDIRVALLRGKSGYICIEKLDSMYEKESTGAPLLAWLYCLGLAVHFRAADADAAGEKVKAYLNDGHFLIRMLRDTSAGSGCTPRHTLCPAQVVTAEALAADLVITNHHKLALLDHDPILSGLFTHYIIDEANHFETAVRNAFREEVRSRDIRFALRYLENRAGRILERAAGEHREAMVRAVGAVADLRAALRDFRDILVSISPRAAQGQVHALPYDHPAFQDGHLRAHISDMQAALKTLIAAFGRIGNAESRRLLRIQARTARRIETALTDLGEAAGALRDIEENIALENNITAYQIFNRNWTLMAQWVRVDGLIRHQIYDRKDCVVYTAATLCHRGKFDSFRAITGMYAPPGNIENEMAQKEFRFARIPSPFSPDAMEIRVHEDAVSGRFDNKAAWTGAITAILPELITRNRGRTLVLFSSYQDLEQIAEKVRSAISGTRYPLLIQRPGQDTVSLCDEFRAIRESVLFGVDTFWYGVDFRGNTLTQVIITRIPYPPPGTPLLMARKKVMSPKEYWNRYHYDMEIKMKQGIGRLIRSDTDRGKVVILDTRYRP